MCLQLLLTRTTDTVKDLLTTPRLLDPLVDEVRVSQGWYGLGRLDKGWYGLLNTLAATKNWSVQQAAAVYPTPPPCYGFLKSVESWSASQMCPCVYNLKPHNCVLHGAVTLCTGVQQRQADPPGRQAEG